MRDAARCLRKVDGDHAPRLGEPEGLIEEGFYRDSDAFNEAPAARSTLRQPHQTRESLIFLLLIAAFNASLYVVLKLKFEALRQFDTAERAIAEGVLDSLIVQHQAKRLFNAPQTRANAAPAPTARASTRKRASR